MSGVVSLALQVRKSLAGSEEFSPLCHNAESKGKE